MTRLPKDFWERQRPTNMAQTYAARSFGVQRSDELERILKIPRRTLDMSLDVTDLFRKPGGTLTLRPIQSAALVEMQINDGLIGAIGVGWGKTLIMLLGPVMVGAKNPLLLVPPELKRQLLERDIPFYSKHFNFPRYNILAYSELSTRKNAYTLQELKPDWIFADEAHRLKARNAARTRRFMDYLMAHPETKCVFLSGSITSKSLFDYCHLAEAALRDNCPVPTNHGDLMDWDNALGPDELMAPGALTMLCKDDEEPVRVAFSRRLAETPGWVSTSTQSFEGSLYLRKDSDVKLPRDILMTLTHLRETWEIGAEEIWDELSFYNIVKQVACGFYYKWKWPGNKPDYAWMELRSAWHREVRDILKKRQEGLDSPKQVEEAIMRGEIQSQFYNEWHRVKHRQPPTEEVWLSDYMVEYVQNWMKGKEGGIIWGPYRALNHLLAKRLDLPYFGAGSDAGTTDAHRDPFIICSMKAQSTGKNLQTWYNNLVLSPPSDALLWEQLIGRTHRQGQLSDEVWVDVVMSTEESHKSLENALKRARYIQGNHQQEQKILQATVLDA